MPDSPIKTKRLCQVLEVTLDRPKANAIDLVTSRIMGDVFAEFRDDADLRVAVLTGAGSKFFCPGWDLKAAADGDAVDGDYGRGGFGGLQELPRMHKPVIAAVNGICCGNSPVRQIAALRRNMRHSPGRRSAPGLWRMRHRSSCPSAFPITLRWKCC